MVRTERSRGDSNGHAKFWDHSVGVTSTLPETNVATENKPSQNFKRKRVVQPFIFRCFIYSIRFREGIPTKSERLEDKVPWNHETSVSLSWWITQIFPFFWGIYQVGDLEEQLSDSLRFSSTQDGFFGRKWVDSAWETFCKSWTGIYHATAPVGLLRYACFAGSSSLENVKDVNDYDGKKRWLQ